MQRYLNSSGRIHLHFLPAEMGKCVAPKYQQKSTKSNTLIYYSSLSFMTYQFFETGRLITFCNKLKLTFYASFFN